MTLIFERDLYMVKMNRCTKYLGQMSFCLNVIFRGIWSRWTAVPNI